MTESVIPEDLLADLADLSDSNSEPYKKPKLEVSHLDRSQLLLSPVLSSTLSSLSTPPTTKEFSDKCNELLLSIESELTLLHKHLRDLFFPYFPELEDIVPSLVDYANGIKILLSSQFSNKDLEKHLGSTTTIAIATALIKSPIPKIQNAEVIELVLQDIFSLISAKARILSYIQHQIRLKAPNLCTLLSEPVAANILSAAGCLEALSLMPACNIQVLGLQKTTLPGLSNLNKFQSFLSYSPFVIKAGNHKKKALRMLAGKAALAARVDRFQESPAGETGSRLLEQIQKAFDRSLEVDLEQRKRPMDVPKDPVKPKRGGKRIRAAKKRFELTDVRKEMNRLQFGVEAQEEFRDTGVGFGMLGKSGKIKVKAKNKGKSKGKEIVDGGMSCFNFTSGNEVSLENPEKMRETVSKYFESTSGFNTVLSGRFMNK